MDELIIQKDKNTQYIFTSDSIVVKKKGKIKHDIKKSDIAKCFYNPTFRKKEFFNRIITTLFTRGVVKPIVAISVYAETFQVFLVNKKIITLKISPSDYEKVKEIMHMKEVGISKDF